MAENYNSARRFQSTISCNMVNFESIFPLLHSLLHLLEYHVPSSKRFGTSLPLWALPSHSSSEPFNYTPSPILRCDLRFRIYTCALLIDRREPRDFRLQLQVSSRQMRSSSALSVLKAGCEAHKNNIDHLIVSPARTVSIFNS